MHRLDPACPEAQRLQRLRASQRALLLEGVGKDSKLVTMVEESYARAAGAHLETCPACRAWFPRCRDCGADLDLGRHGWLCPQQKGRWLDLLPWRWRALQGTTPSRAPVPASAPAAARVAPMRVPAPGAAPTPAREPRRVPVARAVPILSPQEQARKVLGVPAGAREEELRRAFREKAMQYHPDKVATLAPEFRAVAERKMKEINEAYALLTG